MYVKVMYVMVTDLGRIDFCDYGCRSEEMRLVYQAIGGYLFINTEDAGATCLQKELAHIGFSEKSLSSKS